MKDKYLTTELIERKQRAIKAVKKHFDSITQPFNAEDGLKIDQKYKTQPVVEQKTAVLPPEKNIHDGVIIKEVTAELEMSQSENGNSFEKPIFETEDQYYAWCLNRMASGISLENKDVLFKNDYESSLSAEDKIWWAQKMATNSIKERQVGYNG